MLLLAKGTCSYHPSSNLTARPFIFHTVTANGKLFRFTCGNLGLEVWHNCNRRCIYRRTAAAAGGRGNFRGVFRHYAGCEIACKVVTDFLQLGPGQQILRLRFEQFYDRRSLDFDRFQVATGALLLLFLFELFDGVVVARQTGYDRIARQGFHVVRRRSFQVHRGERL